MRAFQAQLPRMKIQLGGRDGLNAKEFEAVNGVIKFEGDDAVYAADLEKLIKSGTRPDITQNIREMDPETVAAWQRQEQAKARPAAARGTASVGAGGARDGITGALKSAPGGGAVTGTEAKHVDAMPGAQKPPPVAPIRDPGTAGPNAAGDANSGGDPVNPPANSDVANRVENVESQARRESITDKLRRQQTEKEAEAIKAAAAEAAIGDASTKR